MPYALLSVVVMLPDTVVVLLLPPFRMPLASLFNVVISPDRVVVLSLPSLKMPWLLLPLLDDTF
ncbi:hypothetical protein N9P77_03625, partial [Amylibacter sp.]|nr:hypothetical protein [Amylibacter sp.]